MPVKIEITAEEMFVGEVDNEGKILVPRKYAGQTVKVLIFESITD